MEETIRDTNDVQEKETVTTPESCKTGKEIINAIKSLPETYKEKVEEYLRISLKKLFGNRLYIEKGMQVDLDTFLSYFLKKQKNGNTKKTSEKAHHAIVDALIETGIFSIDVIRGGAKKDKVPYEALRELKYENGREIWKLGENSITTEMFQTMIEKINSYQPSTIKDALEEIGILGIHIKGPDRRLITENEDNLKTVANLEKAIQKIKGGDLYIFITQCPLYIRKAGGSEFVDLVIKRYKEKHPLSENDDETKKKHDELDKIKKGLKEIGEEKLREFFYEDNKDFNDIIDARENTMPLLRLRYYTDSEGKHIEMRELYPQYKNLFNNAVEQIIHLEQGDIRTFQHICNILKVGEDALTQTRYPRQIIRFFRKYAHKLQDISEKLEEIYTIEGGGGIKLLDQDNDILQLIYEKRDTFQEIRNMQGGIEFLLQNYAYGIIKGASEYPLVFNMMYKTEGGKQILGANMIEEIMKQINKYGIRKFCDTEKSDGIFTHRKQILEQICSTKELKEKIINAQDEEIIHNIIQEAEQAIERKTLERKPPEKNP